MRREFVIMAMILHLGLGCARNQLYTERQFLMGTVVEVISPDPEAHKIVFDEIRRVESVFSTYEEGSLVFRLNREGMIDYNQEIADLIGKSLEFHRLTEGSFEITIGPLSKLWKKAVGENRIPSKEEIDAAMALVGADKLLLSKDTIELEVKGMILDFGAIAKGYAVDSAIRKLKENGINSAIVNAGGDTYCLGSKFGRDWNVGVLHPRRSDTVIKVLKVRDSAVVTSGDYQQFFEQEGKRYSHIINPLTGYPVDNNIISVTVVADSCVLADAVATSVFLMGKEAGLRRMEGLKGVERIIVFTQEDL